MVESVYAAEVGEPLCFHTHTSVEFLPVFVYGIDRKDVIEYYI